MPTVVYGGASIFVACRQPGLRREYAPAGPLARKSCPRAAAILLPVAVCLSVASPDTMAPNAMISLADLGAISLDVGLLVLGVSLIQGGRTARGMAARGE